jgi:cytoskeletal protein CcmA (bactofilin family)
MSLGEQAHGCGGRNCRFDWKIGRNSRRSEGQRVEGTITLTDSKLTIGTSAHVDADVAARDVVILGVLNGNVTATVRVELRKGGNLTGNVRAARLSIEEGALLSGKVELTQGDAAGVRTSPLGGHAGSSS